MGSYLGLLAQLARAPALQAGGCKFKSCTVHRNEDRQWEEFFVGRNIHIVPIKDLLSHALTAKCICGPESYEMFEERYVWLHHAFDMREA